MRAVWIPQSERVLQVDSLVSEFDGQPGDAAARNVDGPACDPPGVVHPEVRFDAGARAHDLHGPRTRLESSWDVQPDLVAAGFQTRELEVAANRAHRHGLSAAE